MVDVKAVCQKVKHNTIARQNKCRKGIEFSCRFDKTFITFKNKPAVDVEVHGRADNSCCDVSQRKVHKGYPPGKCYGKQNKNGIVHQKRRKRRKREPEKPLKAFKVRSDKFFHSPADSPPFLAERSYLSLIQIVPQIK